ncbi:MAG: glycosyltransferase family 2 protein [Sinomicrobium sp.]|nr:glycosyltransferase family 2 protein [Sinomicrobium sp.]
MKFYLVIPAHNEEDFLRFTLNAIARQTLPPKKAVIVNDNSTDGTEAVIDEFVSTHTFFYKVNSTSSSEHLPGSKVVHAFNRGRAILDNNFDFIVKLDADIVLPPDYFETISGIFKKDPKIGLAGGFAYEKDKNNNWILNHPMNHDHVRGAFKAYTKACFEAIGGLRPSVGWDSVDELLARCHGFKVHTDPSLKVKHLRPLGESYHKKARAIRGEAMYKMRYGFPLSFIAFAKVAWKYRNIQLFYDSLKGYFAAKKRKAPFLVSKEEGAFIRTYRYRGIFKKLFFVSG